MKAYSPDLRRRVLSAAPRGDNTIPEVAGLFGLARLGEHARRYGGGDQSFQPLISPPK